MREKSTDTKSSKRPLQALVIHQGRKKEVEYWWTWTVWKPVSAKMRLSVGLGTMGKRRLELKVYKSSLRLLLLSSPLLIWDNWEPEDVLIFFLKKQLTPPTEKGWDAAGSQASVYDHPSAISLDSFSPEGISRFVEASAYYQCQEFSKRCCVWYWAGPCGAPGQKTFLRSHFFDYRQ